MPHLYIIAGPNGAGKTTAALTVLPEILHCEEFVNADAIAAGLSPFHPERVAIEAGKLMLQRIAHLLKQHVDFAIETTLSTKSYIQLIKRAKENGYEVTLLFLWLNSVELAKARVQKRVSQGGHDIPLDVIERRYKRGLENFFKHFQSCTDNWIFYDNSEDLTLIADCYSHKMTVFNHHIWYKLEKLHGL